jgi:hypothetical protein
MLTNAAVTIYNRRRDPDSKAYKYHKTVLSAVHWEPRKAVSIGTAGVTVAMETASDRVNVQIPFSVRATATGSAQGAAKTYADPKAFAAASVVALAALWTLDEGAGAIIKGNPANAPSVATEDELKAILKATPEAYRITRVDTFDMGSERMRHWEVGGE